MNLGFQAMGAGLLLQATGRCRLGSDVRFLPAAQVSVRIERGIEGLASLEHHWRQLAAQLVPSRFIHAYEWQQAYLQHLETSPASVRYITFMAGGEAVAIFPLRYLRRSVGRLNLRLWALPSHPHLVLGEPLISPAWASPELIRRLLNALDTKCGLPWDALHLPNLMADSVTLRLLAGGEVPRSQIETTGSSMFFEVPDLSTALARCSGAFKRNLRRQGKKLAQRGEVSLRIAAEGEALEAAFGEFLRLEASGWKGADGRASAISLHPRLRGFYRTLMSGFARHGACRISLLELNGVAIAAQFCLVADGTLYIQKIAYDEAWHAEAPGSQLLYRMLEQCCADPAITQLSLVTGPQWAVGRWNPESHAVREAHIFNTTWRGLGGLAMRRFKTAVWLPAQQRWTRLRQPASGDEASV